MNDINKVKQQQQLKHPGFSGYLDCMTRALFTGLATVCLSFSSLYFAQKIIQKRLFYPPQYNILISALASTGVAYKVTSDRTKDCQARWMAAEDKHTALKEADF